MSKPDLKEQILSDLKKSGFIAEMKANSILIKNDWKSTFNGETFYDKDLDKSREIDIITRSHQYSDDDKVKIDIHLVIEVKKSEKPWIIFCHPKHTRMHSYLGWGILNTRDNFPTKILSSRLLNYKNRHANSYLYGTSYTEAFKNTSETSQIYQALITSCKAAVHTKIENTWIDDNPNRKYDPSEEHTLGIFLPIVVLDGKLFQATLDEQGEIDLKEVEYCPVLLNYSSQKYDENTFYPEIVTLNEFENHLKSIIEWRDFMVQSAAGNIK